MHHDIDRRRFLQLAGTGSVVTALGIWGCTTASEASPSEGEGGQPTLAGGEPVSFSVTCDVLVVGSGIAGLSAAMAPSEAGLKVVVADKSTLLGGESYESSGMLQAMGTQIQKDAGALTSEEDLWQKRKEAFDARYPDAEIPSEELLKSISSLRTIWVDRMIDSYHAKLQSPTEYLSAGVDRSILIPKSGLEGIDEIMNPLRDQLAEQGVEYLLDHELQSFIFDESGKLCGARLYSAEGLAYADVSARCIVLATGGYAASQQLFAQNLPQMLRMGSCTYLSDGAAMRMAMRIGATPMNLELVPDLLGDVPAVDAWGCFAPMIAVGPDAKRFAREDERYAVPNACFEQELGFWWTIFDQQMGEGVQSNSAAKTLKEHAQRYVGPCDSIEDLAEATGLALKPLADTFKAYAEMCDKGTEDEFGRTANLLPLSAPFHAIKQFPMRFRTVGGLRINELCQVLDGTDTPIEALYACGSCAAILSQGILDNAASGLLAGTSVTESLQSQAAE